MDAGMPYPQNVQTALEIEAIVRANGAVRDLCMNDAAT